MVKSILGAFDGVQTRKKKSHEIEYIHYKDICGHKKNRKLNQDTIEELAELIQLHGLDHNLLVHPIDDENYKYEIIAGHRRYNAILLNINQGDMTYEYIPCKVKNMNDLDAEESLYVNNLSTEMLSNYDKLEAIKNLKRIYQEKKALGEKIPGKLQKRIAEKVNMSSSQVGNYEKILNHATDEVIDLIKNDEITLEQAIAISSLDDENQLKFIEEADGNISLLTIKDYKENLDRENNSSQNVGDIDDELLIENDTLEDSVPSIQTDQFNDSSDYMEDSYDDEIDINNYDDQDDYEYAKDEEQNLMNKYTVQNIVDSLEDDLNMLANKLDNVEWKTEHQIIAEMKKLLISFKTSAKL